MFQNFIVKVTGILLMYPQAAAQWPYCIILGRDLYLETYNSNIFNNYNMYEIRNYAVRIFMVSNGPVSH